MEFFVNTLTYPKIGVCTSVVIWSVSGVTKYGEKSKGNMYEYSHRIFDTVNA